MLTAMMFEYFASTAVELAVLEVGMGGRLDATNIADPCLSVITDIDFDHQKFLGNTLPQIAREKAGILRSSGVVVLLPQHPQVDDGLGEAILNINAPPLSAVKDMPPVTGHAESNHRQDSSHRPRDRFPVQRIGAQIVVDA